VPLDGEGLGEQAPDAFREPLRARALRRAPCRDRELSSAKAARERALTQLVPKAARAELPERDGAVPVSELSGYFELTPLDGASTRVVYQMHLNPGGKLSAGLVNAKNVDTPFETLKNMREVVQREKYRCFRPC
jgi:flagella basal body P-ring formation protein FlgA